MNWKQHEYLPWMVCESPIGDISIMWNPDEGNKDYHIKINRHIVFCDSLEEAKLKAREYIEELITELSDFLK